MKPPLPPTVGCIRCHLPISGTDYIEAPGLGLVAHGREMQCIAALRARIIDLEARAKLGKICQRALSLATAGGIMGVEYMKRAEAELRNE